MWYVFKQCYHYTWRMVTVRVEGSITTLAALCFFNTSLRLLLDASSSSKQIMGVVPGMIEVIRTPHSFARLSWWSLERIKTSWRTSWYDCGIRWFALADFRTCSRVDCFNLLSASGSNTLTATGILSFSCDDHTLHGMSLELSLLVYIPDFQVLLLVQHQTLLCLIPSLCQSTVVGDYC